MSCVTGQMCIGTDTSPFAAAIGTGPVLHRVLPSPKIEAFSKSLRDTGFPGIWWLQTATAVSSGSSKVRHFPRDTATGCWLERDFKYGSFVLTPYVYDEIFYDTRYGQWTPNRYAFGVELPVGQHVVLEPYYLRQNGNRSDPPHVNVLGFKLNLYF